MFYSHEILTSRKYGVATVWLVATLGSRSTSKKINRKAILEVDVPKACRTIIDPAVPMALRLQGNLLYGVTQVYLQQCRYVLSDAHQAYASMHTMLRAVIDTVLDPEAGKARRKQLVLPDDPSFLPEFGMPPLELLAELDIVPPLTPLPVTRDSQSGTSFTSQKDPLTPSPHIGGLILPVSSSIISREPRIHGDQYGRSDGASPCPSEVMIDDPPFTFDENGDFVDLTEANIISETPLRLEEDQMKMHAIESAGVGEEGSDRSWPNTKHGGERMGFDLPLFPLGETLPTTLKANLHQLSEVVGSTSTITAPNRRKTRSMRTLPLDRAMELRNTDLADWNSNYLENMKEAIKLKGQRRQVQQGKKNAEYWTWASGIGGIAGRARCSKGPTPFDMFIGDNLFELFTGVSRNIANCGKRGLDSGIDDTTQKESRRVRQKTGKPEQQTRHHVDEVMFLPDGDDVEIMREAHSALDDQQIISSMPWNFAASARGSSAVPQSGRMGIPGSADPSSSLAERCSRRVVSASPLRGRGRQDDEDLLRDSGTDYDLFGDLGGYDFDFGGLGVTSALPEPAITEIDARVREALLEEGGNFIAYVAEALHEKRYSLGGVDDNEHKSQNEIVFAELLPPPKNSRMVAAQALMIALMLGTKGLLNIHQEHHFDGIKLSLTEKGKTFQAEILASETRNKSPR